MKLDLGKSYFVYTTSDYISNKQIRIVGYISYEKAAQYKNFIENVAINEKFISDLGDTQQYLESLTYYDCAVITLSENGEYVATGEHLILWDDIIDSDRTQRLYEDYVYKLKFKFKNIEIGDNITKDTVEKAIIDFVNNKFNGIKTKVDISLEPVSDNAMNSTETQLSNALEALDKSTEALNNFSNLLSTVKEINTNLVDNNINGRVTNLGTSLDNIETSIEKIVSQLK